MVHQTAIDTLRKTAELLVTSEGNLLNNQDEIQETVGEERSKSDTQHVLYTTSKAWK